MVTLYTLEIGLSLGLTCLYLGLPAMNVTTATAMAIAGMTNPIAQLTFSWIHTIPVTASKLPTLILK
jgi:hypothetical protein